MSNRKRVAIQGISGAFHEIAARGYFEGEEIDIIPCMTFRALFDTLKRDSSILGIVAIENTLAGSLLPNYSLLRESGLKILGEYKLRIKHNLCALPGQSIDSLSEVRSHPMALMQCEEFLLRHKNLKVVEDEDTAAVARDLAENKKLGIAAICSELAAQNYGMQILAPSIETNKKNFTRFLVIGDPWQTESKLFSGELSNKSSMVFALPHEEGSLSKILTILSFYNINLTKIQSVPIIGHAWEYLFYVDLVFDDYIRYRQSIEAIKPLSRNLQILGEYKNVK